MYKIFVFESQISHAIKKQTTFSLKQPKAMPACRRKKRVYFPFDILFLKLLKTDPQTLFSHIQTSAIKRKYPTLIVPIFLFQRAYTFNIEIYSYSSIRKGRAATLIFGKKYENSPALPRQEKTYFPLQSKVRWN